MKIKSTVIVIFILALTCMPAVWGQEAALIEKVREFYDKAALYTETKDLEAHMSLFADDWELILQGTKLGGAREYTKALFKDYDELWAENLLLDITRSGNVVKVISDQVRKGKSGTEAWKEIYHKSELHYLIPDGNSFKILRSAELDKDRMKYVSGQNYKDEQSGFSFTVPKDWSIIPSKHPAMKGFVLALAPDMSSVALFGYLNLPGVSITAQQALEGDEMLSEKLSQEGTYTLVHSGPITLLGYDGFETETEFHIPTTQQRHRRRVYFTADNDLYALCFDAIPSNKWNVVKDGFQSILDSIKLDNPSQ